MTDDFNGKENDKEMNAGTQPQEERLKKGYMESLKEKYKDSGIEIQMDFSSNNPILEADLLITDWSGISWEYAFTTRRPILFIDTPMKVMNPDYQDIDTVPLNIILRDKLGLSIKPTRLQKVGEAVDFLLEKSPEFEERIEAIANEYIYNLGTSAEVGGKFIIEELQRLVLEKQEGGNKRASDNTSSGDGQKA